MPIDLTVPLVEDMQEGALALRPDGCVLFCNRQIALMLQVASEVLLGKDLHRFLSPGFAPVLDALLSDGMQPIFAAVKSRGMIAADGTMLSVLLSARRMPVDGMELLSVIVTDLSHQKVPGNHGIPRSGEFGHRPGGRCDSDL